MFEDSTFASTGKVRMRTRAGFFAAFTFEAVILVLMVVIPLLYPHALPNMVNKILMEAPAPPVQETRPQPRPATARAVPTVMNLGLQFPRRIPSTIYTPDSPEPPIATSAVEGIGAKPFGSGDNPFAHGTPAPVVRPAAPRTVHLPSTIVEGMLVHKTIPVYPAIAVASRTQGTVVLQATISRSGSIVNLRVASGPPMLRQAALDAVSIWRYRPYLLNGQPIEVETTVNVVFKLD